MPFNCVVTLEFNNLWFFYFKLIPKDDISLLLAKYDEELFKIVSQYNQSKTPLEKYLMKLLKEDLSSEHSQDYPKSYCIRVKDSFQTKMLSFIVLINEISLNQLEFKLNIKKSVFQMFLDSDQDLINYLKKEVLGDIFSEILIFE